MPFALAGKSINYKIRCFECYEKEPTTGMYLCGTCIKSKGAKIKELELWCKYLSQATGKPPCSYDFIKANSDKIFKLIDYKRAGWTGDNGKDYGDVVKTELLKLLGYPSSDYSKYNKIKMPYKKVDGTVGDVSTDNISPNFFIPQGANTPEPPPPTIQDNGYTWYISNASQKQLDKAFKKGGSRKSKKKNKKNKNSKKRKN